MDFRELGEGIAHHMIGEGVTVKINKKNTKLVKNIEKFKKECLKREISPCDIESYGIDFYPRWDHKYGFIYDIHHGGAFDLVDDEETRHGHTFEQLIQVTKKQALVLRKARHKLAYLIRLKEKLGLPGPVQKNSRDYAKNVGHVLLVVSQEEIDNILKY